MAVPNFDYTWEQGSDLVLTFRYLAGEDSANAQPVDLTNYKLRMDIRKATVDGERIFTFNSDDIVDGDVDEVGEADNEAVLDADGYINILVPRALTLAGGAMHTALTSGTSVFVYDIFLRDANNKQRKFVSGQITVNKSATLWT